MARPSEPAAAETLSRRVAQTIALDLKEKGHVLLTRGGLEPLTRELDELVAGPIQNALPRIAADRLLVGEVTSTFGDERVDEEIEELADEVTRRLMDSDHVEDVFADDVVIRRDVFRVVRDGLLAGAATGLGVEPEPEPVEVKLDGLGYVAKVVSELADAPSLEDALGRAADASGAELLAFDAAARRASFRVDSSDPDAGLELEEAVAEELSGLVETGVVELPSVERRVPLGRPASPADRKALGSRLEALAARALRQAGTALAWELAGKSVHLRLTPLSEHDAREIERRAAALAGDAAALASEAGLGADGAPAAEPAERPPPSRRGPPSAGLWPAEPPALPEDEPSPPAPAEAPESPSPTRRRAASSKAAPSADEAVKKKPSKSSAKKPAKKTPSKPKRG